MKQTSKHRVILLGASANPERYAYKACQLLLEKGHEIFALGLKHEDVGGATAETQWPQQETFDTLTLYLHPLKQQAYYAQILKMKPSRVIFNPGTENPELQDLLSKEGIHWEEACTLVLLKTGTF